MSFDGMYRDDRDRTPLSPIDPSSGDYAPSTADPEVAARTRKAARSNALAVFLGDLVAGFFR